MATGETAVNAKRQERHQELVISQSNIRGAINRLQTMTNKVKYGDITPPDGEEVEKAIELSSLALVLSNLPEIMEMFVKDIDAIRAELENALF